MTGRVLFVDDDAGVRFVIQKYLSSLGLEVTVAEGGTEAIRQISQAPLDALLSDINMPGMNGLELLRAARALEPDLPVVLLSALADITTVRRALREGGYDYLMKPVDFDELELTLRRAMEHGALLRERREYQASLERKVAERTQELREALGRINDTYRQTILAMGSALETRDVETQAHAQRVSHYSSVIATAADLNNGHLVDIERGAYLHDIGKIGVSDTILLKPGPLSDSEWALMRMHPEIGTRMVANIEFLRGCVPIIRCHHERVDGGGYPQGLRGDAIPVEARVFALADALDAMISDRPYRRGMPFPEAREAIRRGAGSQFDPTLVRLFLELPEQAFNCTA